MSFGKLGSLGRGFGNFGLLGGTGNQPIYRMSADRLMQNTSGVSTAQVGFSAATSCTYRIRRVIPVNGHAAGNLNLILTYANWQSNSTPSVAEYNGPGNITVSLGIEYNTNSALKTWSPADAGARYVTATSGLTLTPGQEGDIPISVPLASGAIVYYELVFVAGASGWNVGITLQPAGTNFDQYSIGNDFHAGSASWTNGAPAGFSAVKIKTLSSLATKGLIVIGDSIPHGTGFNPSDASWVDLGLGWSTGSSSTSETVPLLKLCQSADQASFWAAGSPLRRSLISKYEFSSFLYELGTNDLANGMTLSQLQASTLANLAILAAYGKPITLCTLLPRTNTSNVSLSPTYLAARNSSNAWLYTLIGSNGVVAVFDAAAAVEATPGSQTGTGSNTWTDIRLTIDGIHPSGGAVGSGTSGTIGTTSAGGGHNTIGSTFSASNVI